METTPLLVCAQAAVARAAPRMTRVGWARERCRAGWLVPAAGGRSQPLLLSRWRLFQTPRHLHDFRLRQRFSSLVENSPEFLGWWHETSGGPGDKLFLLDFPS